VLTDIKQNEALGDIMTNRCSHGIVRNCCDAASIALDVMLRVARRRLLALLCLTFIAAFALTAARAQQIGNNPNPGTQNLGQDSVGSPPFVVLQEYSSSAPLLSSNVEFPSAGTVTQVLFYAAGNASYTFNVYALSIVSPSAGGEVTFNVDGSAVVSGSVPATGGGLQTVAVNFPAKAGDLLAFAGIGPSYPQTPNNASESDATYANFTPGVPAGYAATAPSTVVNSQFSVSATGEANGVDTTYAYIANGFGNQGRNYAIAVNFTPAVATTYTVGGAVSGLTGTGSVMLQDNGGDNLSVSANANFTFATPIASGHTYYVTVLSTPPGVYCAVTNPYGTVASANVTNVQVSCAPSTTYSYSGKPFTTFSAGGAYTTSDSVSAALTLSGPLAANLPPTNVMSLPGFVSLTLNDGINAITASFNSCSGGSCNGTAWVMTDANGNLSAWYLDAQRPSLSENAEDIHTLYDPGSQLLVLGQGTYTNIIEPPGLSPNSSGEDEGSYAGNSGGAIVSYYGYEHSSPPGSFLGTGMGGTVVVTPATCTYTNPCQVVPTTQLQVVTAPGIALPTDPVITQTQCFVPVDPRGPNCGAVNGKPAQSLNIASLAQWCPGYGNEVIPSYACGATTSRSTPPGAAGTGFWLNYGVAESLDGTNGLDIFDGFTPPAGNLTPGCPPQDGTGPGRPYNFGIVIGGTRSASNTEEQHPEGTLIDITDSCDILHGAGPPGASVIGQGFALLQADPTVKHQSSEEILLDLANNNYVNTYIVAGLTHYPKNSPVETQLLLCLAESQILLNLGNAKCSSQRLFQCGLLIQNTPVATFGPSKTPLRIPDPYGDLYARVLHQFFMNNTQIGGGPPISLYDLLHQSPLGHGPYPECPAL
jgi:hypothetical protein